MVLCGLAMQKREAKAALEAAGKLWEDMHGPQARLRRKDDEVYQVRRTAFSPTVEVAASLLMVGCVAWTSWSFLIGLT